MKTASESLLFVLFLMLAAVFVMRLIEARLLPRPFTGLELVLALALFMPCALISFVRMRHVALWVSGGILDFENLGQQMQETLPPFYLGIGASIVALLSHLLLYLFTRSQPPSDLLAK